MSEQNFLKSPQLNQSLTSLDQQLNDLHEQLQSKNSEIQIEQKQSIDNISNELNDQKDQQKQQKKVKFDINPHKKRHTFQEQQLLVDKPKIKQQKSIIEIQEENDLMKKLQKKNKEKSLQIKNLDEDLYVQEELDKKKIKYRQTELVILEQKLQMSNFDQIKKQNQKSDLKLKIKSDYEKQQLIKQDQLSDAKTRALKFIKELDQKKQTDFVQTKPKVIQQEQKKDQWNQSFKQNEEILRNTEEKKKFGYKQKESAQEKFKKIQEKQKQIEIIKKQKEIDLLKQHKQIIKQLKQDRQEKFEQKNKILDYVSKNEDKKQKKQKQEKSDYQIQNDIQESKIKEQEYEQLEKQQQQLKDQLQLQFDIRNELDNKLKELKFNPNLIEYQKDRFISFGMVPKLEDGFKFKKIHHDQTADDSQNLNTLLDDIMNKSQSDYENNVDNIQQILEYQGLNIQSLYCILDQKSKFIKSLDDGLLTLKEIQEKIIFYEINFNDQELETFLNILKSQNKDQVFDQEDFFTAFQFKAERKNVLKNIIQQLNHLSCPVVLEEKLLDIKYKRKLIQEDLDKSIKVNQVEKIEINQNIQKLFKIEDKLILKKQKEQNQDEQIKFMNQYDSMNSILEQLNSEKKQICDYSQRNLKEIQQDIQKILFQIQTLDKEIINQQILVRNLHDQFQGLIIKETAIYNLQDRLNIETYRENNEQIQKAQRVHQYQIQQEDKENNLIQREIQKKIELNKIIKVQANFKMYSQRKKYLQYIKYCYNIIRKSRTALYRKRQINADRLFLQLYREMQNPYKKVKKEYYQEFFEFAIQKDEFKKSQENAKQITLEIIDKKQQKKEEIEQLEQQDFTSRIFVGSLIIQMHVKKIQSKNLVFDNLYFPESLKQICEYCSKKPVAKICQKCYLAFYCDGCFALQHKSSFKKNHKYFSKVDEIISQEETPQIIQQLLEQVKVLISNEKMDDLFEYFKEQDLLEIGIFNIELVEKGAKRIFPNKSDYDQIMQLISTKFVVSQATAEVRFGDKVNQMEKNKVYFDYQDFISQIK